jgi:hypothetical protein
VPLPRRLQQGGMRSAWQRGGGVSVAAAT